ncbi:MAG TPA: recombination protein U [Acholeplasmataceae bacterium]|nr:recombination protein U [Acholeplasmataceae bacterium]
MLFENALNESNKYYLNKNIAVIYKKPTPIQVVRVDYPQRSKAKIVEAYYKTPSTTDYNGIYRGKYIDYEAKETNNFSFSFKHIAPHQINHLLQVDKHGGIAFIIIYFKRANEVYLIDIKDFYHLYQLGNEGHQKSIKFTQISEIGKKVKIGYSPAIDYLKAVDELYF